MLRQKNVLIGARNIVATGSTVADAALLGTAKPPSFILVTGADGAKGVKLPSLNTARGGCVYWVKNDEAANAILKVYPFSGDAINALSVDTVYSQPANLLVAFISNHDGTTWFTLAQTTTTTTPASITSSGAIKSTSSSGGIGYGVGAGGAVSQGTSRATSVTINTPTGAITLVSAAGSATPFSFTVTNSSVAATDTVVVSQKSGTDKYTTQVVTNVAAGSFVLTLANAAGTTTETPVFNYTVIKGVAS